MNVLKCHFVIGSCMKSARGTHLVGNKNARKIVNACKRYVFFRYTQCFIFISLSFERPYSQEIGNERPLAEENNQWQIQDFP